MSMTPSSPNRAMPELRFADEAQQHDMLDLLQHARDAELLERVALNSEHDASRPLPRLVGSQVGLPAGKPSLLAMMRRAGAPVAAAAAAVAFLGWVVVTRPSPSAPLASNTQAPALIANAPSPITTASTRQAAVTVSDFSAVDMSLVASIDPEAEFGLPSLSDERRMVIAVPVRFSSVASREAAAARSACVDWSVLAAEPDAEVRALDAIVSADDAAAMIASKVAVCVAHEASAEASDERKVVLFEVQGPRVLLPFHDDDAHALAACLGDSVEVRESDDASLVLTKCAELAGACVPAGLAVSATLLAN